MLSYTKLMVWAFIWLILGPFVMLYRAITKTPRTNCLFYAIDRWDHEPEGYLVIRWCRSSKTRIKWPHFLYLEPKDHQQLQHCLPATDFTAKHLLPDLIFDGKIQQGDPTDVLEN